MNLIRSINGIITTGCNCRCVHCDIWRQKPATKISTAYLKKVLADPVIKESHKHYGPDFDIALGGGEPFGVNNLQEIVEEIEMAFSGSLKTISTNGLLRERIVDFIRSNASLNFKLNISIDGIGKIHDSIRGHKGAFQKVIGTITKIRQIRPNQKIDLKLTLMPQNYDQISKVYKLADKLNCGFSFKPAENMSNYTNKAGPVNFSFTKEQLCIIRNQAFYISDEVYKKGDFKKARFFRDIPFYLFSKKKPRQCSVLDNDITLMPDGSCYSCVQMPSLGRLSDAGLGNIWKSRPRDIEKCHSCMLMCGTYKDYLEDRVEQRIANFEITTRCNLDCAMCTQKELRIEDRTKTNKDMDAAKFREIIEKHSNITHVSFLGGESFLNKYFFEMMGFLDSRGITYEITTNGTLINKKMVEKLKDCAGLKMINFSLDGLAEYHDRERGDGVFRRCQSAIKLTKKLFNLNICSIMRNDNLKEIPRLSIHLPELGVRSQKIIYGMSLDKNSRLLSQRMAPSMEIQGPVMAGPAENYKEVNMLLGALRFLEKRHHISIRYEPAVMEKDLSGFLGGRIADQPGIICHQLMNYRFNSKGERIVCEFIRNEFYTFKAIDFLQESRFFPVCQKCCKLKLFKTS